MSFDIVLHIAEDSPRGRAIQQMATAQKITPEQAIDQIIDAGILTQPEMSSHSRGKTPAEMLLGLFSTSEDSALMDEVEEIAYEGRRTGTTRAIVAHRSK